MFQVLHHLEADFCGARNREFSRALNPALQNFDTWLAKNKSRIPIQ
jgi:hypothetical protein